MHHAGRSSLAHWWYRLRFHTENVCKTSGRFHLDCPPSDLCIVVSPTKARQTSVLIIEAASKSEGLETGVGVHRDVAEVVIVHALYNCTSRGVNHQSRATEVIGDDPVRDAGLYH